MRSDRLARLAALASLAAVGACELDEVAIPRTDHRLSMHSVLSASATTQVVLLERTRNGSVFLLGPPFDLTDPVVSDEGIAESGATVELTTPTGQSVVAIEDNILRGDGKGAGIYRFQLLGSALQRGGSYRLTVRTIDGKRLTAETSVPAGAPAMLPEQRVFDRARDTVVVDWPASAGARSYFVRIETPFGPRSFFTDSTRIRLTGDLRNVDVNVLPRVFIPGFPQAITVSAVDSNYYDWYRTHNDALSGTGLANRVTGGFGVFGALVRLRFQEFRVVAPQTDAVAGLFRFDGTPEQRATTPYLSLELYLESRAGRSDQPDALSGRFERRPTFSQPNDPIDGLLGSVRDGRVELSFLRSWSASDTVEVFTGQIRGDTITGTYRGFGGIARFVKQR